MNKEEFIKEVIVEANNIKKFATSNEIKRLSFAKLKPTWQSNCIYGQMSGDCFNLRGFELIKNCATKYFIHLDDTLTTGYELIENGRTISSRNFSAIEAYIVQNEAKNKVLIDYLKGKRKTLTVKSLMF